MGACSQKKIRTFAILFLMKKKKILMIAYYFPPFGGVPVQRTIKFIKYLLRYEWTPVVLTAREGHDHFHPNDYSLLSKISDKVEVRRTRGIDINTKIIKFLRSKAHIRSKKISKDGGFSNKTVKLRKLLYNSLWFPDEKNYWIPGAIISGLRILVDGNIKIIYVSGFPWSAFFVGAFLSMVKRIPLVLDYRDSWTLYPRGFWDNRFHMFWESIVLRQASKVIFVTNSMHKGYIERYPWIDRKKFVTITNGFDQENFIGFKADNRKKDKLLITYTGTFNDNVPPLDIDRNPYYFIKALSTLLEEHDVSNSLRVRFVGNFGENNTNLIKTLGLDNIIELTGSVSHDECIKYQMETDILLLIIYPCKQTTVPDLSGKLLEYIGARKPILALVPDCEARDLIVKERLGKTVWPKDIDGIKEAIFTLYKDWKQNKLRIEGNDYVYEKYEMRALTKKLVETIEDIT